MKIDKSRRIMFFVSLIGIVVVTLIMGTTFAYQTLVVDYKEGSDNELTIDVGKLDVSFTTSNKIELTNMTFLPDYKTADYVEFTINTNDTSSDVAYQINLTNLEYSNSLKSEDFMYTITLIDDNGEVVIGEGNFVSLSGTESNLLFSTSSYRILEKGKNETLRLYLWLKETNEDQNYLKKAEFKGKINITSVFKEDMPFAQTIIDNAKEAATLNETTRTKYSTTFLTIPAEEPSRENERLLLETEDDYTATTGQNSYYFRGNVNDNYVTFANMCWRIVRIAGDGSVKLVLEDQDEPCSTNINGNWNIPTTTGGTTRYGNFGYNDTKVNSKWIADYLNPGTNSASGSMSTAFKNFQTTKLSSYLSDLKVGEWCLADKAYASSSADVTTATPLTEAEKEAIYRSGTWNENDYYWENAQNMYYDSYVRLYGNSTKTPTLKCNGTTMDKFGDNTTDMYVGALTADEIVYAGGKLYNENYAYYLLNDYQRGKSLDWWALSPHDFSGNYDFAFRVDYIGGLVSTSVNDDLSFRPAVSLAYFVTATTNPDTVTYGEPGTIGNPYVIE